MKATKRARIPVSGKWRTNTAAGTKPMPGGLRAIVADAERRFPVRIAIKLPPGGTGQRYKPMTDWLDENCGIDDWSMAPAGMRGIVNDSVAVYISTPTCAVAFVARWCVAGDPSGFYDLRQQEPAQRIPASAHSTSSGFPNR
jgi:hypothetical protein